MAELSVDQLLTVDQAIAILDAVAVRLRIRRVGLIDSLGRVLAEDVLADRDYPPFGKSLMDGFAVRSADASAAGVELRIVETIVAGQVGQRAISAGEAAAIMTGAPLPAGANCVVPVEHVSRAADRITVNQPAAAAQAVARQGTDAAAGQLLLNKGTLIGPAQSAVLASVGLSTVLIYDPPVAAILSTGDELVEIDQNPTGGQIRNCNSIMMHSLITRLGCQVRDMGMVRDDPDRIRAAIEEGLKSDVLFVTGGMSVGERDYVPGIFRELGLRLEIEKLRIKPGKPFVLATGSDGRLAFGLPGNPVSAFVCTVRLAGRVLQRIAGRAPDDGLRPATLRGQLPANGPREHYIPAICHHSFLGDSVEPLQPNGSADIFTLAGANCLIRRRAGEMPLSNGDQIVLCGLP